jgi:hypothetical protein
MFYVYPTGDTQCLLAWYRYVEKYKWPKRLPEIANVSISGYEERRGAIS